MLSTISQSRYPDRQAFFARLSMSLSLQPAIKIGPAPLPIRRSRLGPRDMREGGASRDTKHSATNHQAELRLKPGG
jgi:hypothetical protein